LHGAGFTLTKKDFDSWGYKYSDSVVKPYLNGKDLARESRELFAIDFYGMSLSEASKYERPFQKVLEEVKPERDVNERQSRKENWWLFGENAIKTRDAISGLNRYIATPETTKHRVFSFLDGKVLPDNMVVTIALDDAYAIGVLSSHTHVCWALAAGGRMATGNTPRYNKTVCFDPFPFPDPTPEQKQKIRDLGERLDAHRKQVQASHPDITITGMYNLLEKLRAGEPFTDKDREYNDRALVSTLKQIHDELDAAVLDAYGWEDLKDEGKRVKGEVDEIILERLVALNAQRAEEERNGLIRWLRPEYQAPNEVQTTQTTLEGVIEPEEAIVEPVEQQKWPTQPKEQLAAIRDLLRTTPGEWTVAQISAQFTGKNTKKKLDAITENLERLEWFGMVIAEERNGLTHWHFAEGAIAA